MEIGLEKVHQRGGQPSEPRKISYDYAKSLGRRPCITCYPHLYRASVVLPSPLPS